MNFTIMSILTGIGLSIALVVIIAHEIDKLMKRVSELENKVEQIMPTIK